MTWRLVYRINPKAIVMVEDVDLGVLACPTCHGRMKLLALVTAANSCARYLAAIGEPTVVPGRAPSRGPPYWKSSVLRRKALGDVA